MQRILSRGEIESLDHTAIARVRLPQPGAVFQDRANRLRQLAAGHPLLGYLELMARVADAQHALRDSLTPPGASPEQIERAQAYGLPTMQATAWPRDPRWRDVLDALLEHLLADPALPAEAAETCHRLRALAEQDPAALERLADVLTAESDVGVDALAAPFVMAALQVYWTALASRFDAAQLPVTSPPEVCPVCASAPVASIVRVGGQYDGYRYLCCPLCATEWHRVRVTCSHCGDNEKIVYHSVESRDAPPTDDARETRDRAGAVRAESCDHCGTYRKIFYQEKDLYVDPVADDLASLALDILMGEAGYQRASGNPLLWHGEEV
ncbi:formate dehydrogenase accessory protein FdhE [Verticiella sediminum]|uniref:Protein FdhE homolog n=1 Tax=Verticiella sediminum TaxID=1247510 RepID=A0A556AXI6_9BURK|nr:formate dehydrogenase accessory protein FdhE [Verticiella sediminum]TSH97651.1 formate dehydrogenase accessory protein FdhE [Verticiella sediminum]